MFSIYVILILVAAVLLIVVVLAQNPKGGGLSDQFGGSSSSQLIGVKRTGDLLEKLTWGLIVAIFAIALISKSELGTTSAADAEEEDKTEVSGTAAPAKKTTTDTAQ